MPGASTRGSFQTTSSGTPYRRGVTVTSRWGAPFELPPTLQKEAEAQVAKITS